MKFNPPLTKVVLLKRYKRFFADVQFAEIQENTLEPKEMCVHVPNTGSLKSVIQPEAKQNCWISFSNNPDRKLKGTLEAVQTLEQTWVGVNTGIPNKIVQEAAVTSLNSSTAFFKHWSGYSFYKSEAKISKETRLDGVFYHQKDDLEHQDRPKHYIEIKNTTLRTLVNGVAQAQFPDAVTERGQKHLHELMQLMKQGNKAELIFVIQRNDVQCFSVASQIDPRYAELFQQAVDQGLIITPVIAEIGPEQFTLSKTILPFCL